MTTIPVALIKPHHLTVGVLFQPIGLILDYNYTSAASFANKISSLPPMPTVLTALPARDGWQVSVPLFNPGEHVTYLSPSQVTKILFYSNQPNWKFVDGGFETKDPAHMSRFQGTTIVNSGTGVRTTFIPTGQVGETFPYNLYMETVVWVTNKKNGHAKIIIDPVAETGTVRR